MVISLEMEFLQTIYPGWLPTVILPISTSQVARIGGMCHLCPSRDKKNIGLVRGSLLALPMEVITTLNLVVLLLLLLGICLPVAFLPFFLFLSFGAFTSGCFHLLDIYIGIMILIY
jgi:hypothetical protein